MRRILCFLSSALVLFVCALPTQLRAEAPVRAASQTNLPPLLREVGIDQKLNNQIPLDLVFRDEAGNDVRLGQYFGQKPVLLVLAYYDCPMLCTIVLNGVLHSVKELKYNIGREFEIVTVSFDPTEKPSLAAAKKAIYVGLYGRPNTGAGWHFLTGDEASIQQLTQAVGFRYNYDPQTKQYFHATGIMVLTPEAASQGISTEFNTQAEICVLDWSKRQREGSARRWIRCSCTARSTTPQPGSTA